ncbi:MAG TPA: hypothetical protein VFR86_10515 [Burkholderiaceae bacterium]|nr:hypothetical protein [Burkholderiaceae bacterium]
MTLPLICADTVAARTARMSAPAAYTSATVFRRNAVRFGGVLEFGDCETPRAC